MYSYFHIKLEHILQYMKVKEVLNLKKEEVEFFGIYLFLDFFVNCLGYMLYTSDVD